MSGAKKTYDVKGKLIVMLPTDDLGALFDFAQRSGLDPHDLIARGQLAKNAKNREVLVFPASYAQRKDSPPSGNRNGILSIGKTKVI